MSPISILLIITTICGYTQARDVVITEKLHILLAHSGILFGNLTIGLFGNLAPTIVQNFVTLATNENAPSYIGSNIHRIDIDKIEGGKITSSGSTSIYNGQPFRPEYNNLPHKEAGLVSMTYDKNYLIGSQFIITTPRVSSQLDGKHIVFGKLLDQESYRTLEEFAEEIVDKETHEPRYDIAFGETKTIPVQAGGETITLVD